METTEYQFDKTMRHFNRTTLVFLFLSLLLSTGAMAQPTGIPTVEWNRDRSYNVEVVVETFKQYVDDSENLPTTDEEISDFIRYFLKYMGDDTDDYGKVYRFGGDGTEELTDADRDFLLVKVCEDYLKQKVEPINNTSSPNQKNEKAQPEKRDMPMTYKQIALRYGLPAVIVLLVLSIVIIVIKAKRKKKNDEAVTSGSPYTYSASTGNDTNDATKDVIIRRKTSSVLHKQSLDDVVKDGNYMTVDCNAFCDDTAVKKMYIKNSVIMDIYNMYAEDLRNPNNPKEDGCMVLGRWVHNEQSDEYDVSLEEVVYPGDDAVFAEYELDFGGKIKVKVNERLRKLRRESNLQYDLTCWVHSHPGLGVFFSNTDCSLHMLHKHSTHPKFLTAIVIDILTPQQDLGIFTFKHDMTINSKADIKQMYSLEEWYKWAVESKRTSVVYEEHFSTLEKAKSRNNACYDIQLSYSTIIDIDLIANGQNSDGLYFIHGFSTRQSEQTTHMAEKIKKTDTLADNELIGCFLTVAHRSYPTIRKVMANYLDKVRFVLVYSTTNGMLTTIPIIGNDLCTDEAFYGEQPLEELKIWTRRKR